MNFQLIEYTVESCRKFALVNTNSKEVYIADMSSYDNEMVWKKASNPVDILWSIHIDKNSTVIAQAKRAVLIKAIA